MSSAATGEREVQSTMRRFVFRATAALELRRRQDEDAQRERAAAQARREAAAARVEAAREDLRATFVRGAVEESQGGGLAVRVWYRNWIVGLRQRLARCERELAEREGEELAATERALVAHRNRRALERFHDRALAAWQDAERREEQKAIDELAASRFVRRRAGGIL